MGTFKLLALHVDKDCNLKFLKNLQTDYTYYFVSGYRYNPKTKWLDKDPSRLQLDAEFFMLEDSKSTLLNFSAIVGKNGDGKSSLVDMLLRLLNNFSYYAGYKHHHKSLTAIDGLLCKLYFEKDGSIYSIESAKDCIFIKNGDGARQLSNSNLLNFIYKSKEFEKFDFPMFNSLIYNNSLYGFRESEYDAECRNANKNWLTSLFNKSDKYQVPINLIPYRQDGIIDIGVETSLNHQRMIDFFTHVWVGKKIPDSQYEPYGVAYRLSKDEKLVRKVLTYSNEIRTKTPECPEDLMRFWQEFSNLYVNYEDFYKSCFSASYKSKERGVFYKNTEDILNDTDQFSQHEREIIKKDSVFPLALHKRITLIIAVYELWMSSSLVPKKDGLSLKTVLLSNLDSDRDRCLLYLIYKTINLFDKYPDRYLNCITCWLNDDAEPLRKAFGYIIADIKSQQGSVLTLKLRQALNYINYTDELAFESKISDSIEEYTHFISFADLSNITESCFVKYGGKVSKYKKPRRVAQQKINFLLPPIYETEIIVKSDTSTFKVSRMSSGQRQLLNLVSTLSYHLKNIDDIPVAKGWVNYQYVNVILDEVDLYFHPEYQRKLVKFFIDIFGKQNFKVIKAINFILITHSPFVLSDIPKNQVLFIREGKQDYSMQENTFGANIHTLLKNGFFLEGMPIGDFAKEKINQMLRALNDDKIIDEDTLDVIERDAVLVSEPLLRNQLVSLIAIKRKLLFGNEIKEMRERLNRLEGMRNA